MEIRPIWEMDQAPVMAHPEPNDLLTLEKTIAGTLKEYVELLRAFDVCTEAEILQAESLLDTAFVDLVAGCEIARCGYLKQAFSLWRSWFEQVIFAIYFLEAPIHRQAWKVSENVTLKDSPKYRLMLHQLLTDSGERHAFALMYGERYAAMMEIFKISNPKKDDEIIRRATRVLTLLSQGVHGTFRPKRVESVDKACGALKENAIPALLAAWSAASQFWLLFIAASIDLPGEAWTALRSGGLTQESALEYFEDGSNQLLSLNNPFKTAFAEIN